MGNYKDKLKQKIISWLNWGGKYTKTDNVYLLKGGFWLTLGQIISSASAFLLAIAFANLLSPEIYGKYKYILSLTSLFSIFTLPGINGSLMQAIARGYEGSFGIAIKTKIYWGTIGSLFSLVGASYYFINGNITFTFALLITSVFLPFMDTFSIYESILQGKQRFQIATKYNILSKIISAGIIIGTITVTNNIFILLAIYFASNTILRGIFLRSTLKYFPPNNQVDNKTISYGKHLSLIGVVNIVAFNLDKILIFHYLGALQLAIYAFAIAPLDQTKSFLKTLSSLALPKLANKNFVEINSLIKSRLAILTTLGGLFALIYIFLSPIIFDFAFPKYLDAVFFSQVFAIGFLFKTPQVLLSSILSAKLVDIPKKILYKYQIIPQVILILLLLFLTPIFGVFGTIIARVMTSFVSLFISWYYWIKVSYK